MPAGAEHGSTTTAGRLRTAWRAATAAAILAGMAHLVNVVGQGRLEAGPLLITPFRVAFVVAWLSLIALLLSERRRFHPAGVDLLVAGFSLFYIARAAFEPGTFSTSLNWVMTGAGIYFLVRLGLRDKRDLRWLLLALVGAMLAIDAYGLVEYIFKRNPLFESIEVFAIGSDERILLSEQYYRIRSLVGHPGYAAALVLAGMPLLTLALWRRRYIALLALGASALVVILTFSRGTWLVTALVSVPLLLALTRTTFIRYIRWAALAALVPLAVAALLFWGRDEAFVETQGDWQESEITWVEGYTSPVVRTDGGIRPRANFLYFDVADGFAGGSLGSATVVVHYIDNGTGILRLDYFAAGGGVTAEEDYIRTPDINKTDTGESTNAAFYLEQPRFDADGDGGSDFRLIDQDSSIVVRRVEVHAGRLDPLSQVIHQWEARAGSFATRMSLYPFAWDVFRASPWGVGPFNSPGTGHHAVDSMPLTWLMEFGWLSFVLLGGLALLLLRELFVVLRKETGVATVLLASLVILFLHGGHLMILYDKPSIVMLGALLGMYAAVRPGRGGPELELSLEDCRV